MDSESELFDPQREYAGLSILPTCKPSRQTAASLSHLSPRLWKSEHQVPTTPLGGVQKSSASTRNGSLNTIFSCHGRYSHFLKASWPLKTCQSSEKIKKKKKQTRKTLVAAYLPTVKTIFHNRRSKRIDCAV